MILLGARGQPAQYDLLTFDGTITSGGTAQTLLPAQKIRSYLMIQNISTAILTVGIGPATATATLSSGKITSVAVNNAGLGYTIAPQVIFLGGLVAGDFGTDLASVVSPSFRPAKAVATISAGAISAITVTDQGQGYLVAPYVYLFNPWNEQGSGIGGGGAFIPSATSGITLAGATAPAAGGSLIYENTVVPTSAVNIFGATTAQAFVCKVGI